MVEFLTLDGDTAAVATVLPSQARSVTSKDITHARRRGDTSLNAMYIPYVIDNQSNRMADVLCRDSGEARRQVAGHCHRLLQRARVHPACTQGLQGLGSFRLLLGDEPQDGESVGLRPRAASRLVQELNAAPFDEATLLSG